MIRPVLKPVKKEKTKKKGRIGKTDRGKLLEKIDHYESDIALLCSDFKCMMCGKTASQNHHFFSKKSHGNVRSHPDNHCTLCYACHMLRVHGAGETEELRDRLIARLGAANFELLKVSAYITVDVSLEELKDRLYIKQCILVSTADLYPRRARKLTNAGKERLRIAKNKIAKENLQAKVQGLPEVV
jgi:hypothetical protein